MTERPLTSASQSDRYYIGKPGSGGDPAETRSRASRSTQFTAPSKLGSSSDDSASGITLKVPLIQAGNDSSIEEAVSTSKTVPVLLAFWSKQALDSQSDLKTLEKIVLEYAGRFQLLTFELEQVPVLAQAMQVQAVPTLFALLAGRPVPLAQGTISESDLSALLDELSSLAQQMGVTGKVALPDSDGSDSAYGGMEPLAHAEARKCEEEGDLDEARARWEQIISSDSHDETAKEQLARVRLAIRSQQNLSQDSVLGQADQLMNDGQEVKAFNVLLREIKEPPDDESRNQARIRLLELFKVAGHTQAVKEARSELATILMV